MTLSTRRLLVLLSVTLLTLALCASEFAFGQNPRQKRQAAGNTVVDGQAKAPLGTYTASTGGSASTAGASTGGRFARTGRTTGATAGGDVVINLTGYSNTTELQTVANAGSGNVAATIKGLSGKGTVTIAGQSFTVTMASSATVGANYVIYLLSATPFSASGPQGATGQGGSVGMIELTVPTAGGVGSGKLYTSTQVVVSPDGTVTAHAGASTATALSSVTKS